MQPDIDLDVNVLGQNTLRWRERAGASLRAVIKSRGYGWGFKTIVDAIDDVVDGYYVSDADEFEQVRPLTRRTIATLIEVPAHRVGGVLDRAGVPTVSSPEGLCAAQAWARAGGKRACVRIALRGAVGWSGIAAEQMEHLAPLLADRRIEVEFSTHITDPSLQAMQTSAFESALHVLHRANVAVVATDIASSLPLTGNVVRCSQVRLGVGLFGARFCSGTDVRCAITVRAPLVECMQSSGQRVGYGVGTAPFDGYLAVVRCGYGDGFPRIRKPTTGLLAVGMQFTVVHRRDIVCESGVELINRETDLDLLAAAACTSVHELVVALGLGSSALRRDIDENEI